MLNSIKDSSSKIELPSAVSATPGTLEKEDQPVRNLMDESCVVLVVGGTRGIGLEFVKQCAERGAKVIATHRGDSPPNALLELMKKHDDDVGDNIVIETLTMDVSDETSIAEAAAELQSRSNFRPITHIIHSAGIYLPGSSFDGKARGPRTPSAPVTKDIMMETYLINTVGPLMVAQSFVSLMGRRKINNDDKTTTTNNEHDLRLPVLSILTSKVGSVDDNGSGGAYAYRASKSALNNVAKSLSIDLTGEASVLLLHPGYVRTEMTGGNGFIDVDESVSGMMRAIESTDASVPFRLVDYKACLIPW
eukprot:CAMPEP_0197825394 /NCGR_PEP_ID=MMETSP1437-20131217/2488_1 /TAXON_ID=49252 ORGANISM="Eucampia antarctica, Strain CCMP1452" /NCGR_SAMPLE_ID=MMETSP1437 /ASSEMBLY_ACC=CAM_ASM_001096 /LENGTH=305 /DNA_ID=CAMNT_0043425377 /DNA_START=215 /DNA_END=1132 /DNA_ORIENTATION=+